MAKQDHRLVWVRVRTKSSASLGDWFWRRMWVPKQHLGPRAQSKWLKDNGEIEALADSLSTGSEHWRGIDWEVREAPAHIIDAQRTSVQDSIDSLMETATALQVARHTAPRVQLDAPVKKECRQWPGCGCLKQSRTKDCREPYYSNCVIDYEGKPYRVTKSPVPKIERNVAPDMTRPQWKAVKVDDATAVKMVAAMDARLKEIRDEVAARHRPSPKR